MPKEFHPVPETTDCIQHSLKLTAKAPEDKAIPKGNDRIPTNHFKGRLLLVSGRAVLDYQRCGSELQWSNLEGCDTIKKLFIDMRLKETTWDMKYWTSTSLMFRWTYIVCDIYIRRRVSIFISVMSLYIYIYIYIWVFPQMVVPPFHTQNDHV